MPITPGILPSSIQASVTVRSATQPLRVGAYGPSLVINTSFAATVWISETDDVRDGLGVPLGPGTSAEWTGASDLWVILGTDAGSAGQAPVVIVTSAVAQWQPNPIALATAILNSGIIAVDQPAVLLSRASANPIANPVVGSVLGVFDVSRYRSVIVGYVPNPAGHTIDLNFVWCSSLAAATAGPAAYETMGEDRFTWIAADTSVLEAKVLPVRGAALRVFATLGAGAGTGDFMTVMASNRELQLAGNLGGFSRRIITASAGALAGGTGTVSTPGFRYDGPAVVAAFFNPTAAGQTVDWQLYDTASNLFFAAGTLVNTPAVTVVGQTVGVVCPRFSWAGIITNRAGVALTCGLSVTAAPEGT